MSFGIQSHGDGKIAPTGAHARAQAVVSAMAQLIMHFPHSGFEDLKSVITADLVVELSKLSTSSKVHITSAAAGDLRGRNTGYGA